MSTSVCLMNEMKRSLLFILLLLTGFFFLPGNSFTDTGVDRDLHSFLEKIRTQASDVHSFSCSFSQEKHLSLFPKPVFFHGKLKLIRPDKLRWSFISPVPSTLIFNGDKGVRCDDKGEPIHFSIDDDPVIRIVAEQIWSWLNNDFTNLSKHNTIEKTGETTLRISPTNTAPGQWQATISITFDQDTFHPQKVVITEPEGDLTKIMFSDYLFNTDVPLSTFTQCR